jgi:hypothetical protein
VTEIRDLKLAGKCEGSEKGTCLLCFATEESKNTQRNSLERKFARIICIYEMIVCKNKGKR